MKKRVLSFLLCLFMLLPLVLVSCGQGDELGEGETPEEDLYVKPATLNFYIIADSLSLEALAAKELMQDAFNEYSRLLYKTQVEFTFCSAEEYETVITQKLRDAAASNEIPAAEQYENEVIEVVTNDINVEIEQYPSLKSNQVDILLITSKDMYDRFRDKGYLANLTSYLATDNVGILSSVNTTLLNGASENGSFYGIPNNVTVGSYRYLLINRRMAEYFYMEYSDFQMRDANFDTVVDYTACLDFAQRIAANSEELKSVFGSNLSIYPLNEYFSFPTVDYFKNAGKDTIFGFSYSAKTELGDSVNSANVFENEIYRSHFAFMLEAKAKGFYPAEDAVIDEANTIYGIRYIDEEEYGDYADRILWQDDYFVYEVDSPRLADDEAFKSMFAVSSYSASVGRSLEIIEALLSDTTLRNLLQYGLEETHYFKNDDGTITRTSDGEKYLMNKNYTGNVVLTYPCREDGMDVNFPVYFKNHNDAAMQGPLYGFDFDAVWDDIITQMTQHVVRNMLSKDIDAAISSLTVLKELDPQTKQMKNATLDTTKKALLMTMNPYIAAEDQESTVMNDYIEYLALLMTNIDPSSITEDTKSIEFPADYAEALSSNKAAVRAMIAEYEITAEYTVRAHISSAIAAGELLMEEALACETAEEFNAFYESIRTMRSSYKQSNNAVAILLFEERPAQYCHGMLTDGTFNTPGNPADPWTLLGYIKTWYNKR